MADHLQYDFDRPYYVSDIWSTRLVMDASGNVIGRMGHLPFGEEFAESGTQEKHHFTSYDVDESGTDYAVNRQYSPSLGRFQSADPYQASDYQVNPQSWNRYSYVENDPIHNVDPSGLFSTVSPPNDPDACGSTVIQPPPPPKPRLKYISTFGYVKQFFIDNPHCVERFQDLNIYEGFLKTAESARYADFTDPWNSQWTILRFKDVGLKSNPTRNATIFPTLWFDAFAVSWWDEQVVTIGGAFYSQGYTQQLRTVVHEDLHLYFRQGHIDIARKLGLGEFANEDGASLAIDVWLEHNCP